MCGHSSTDMHMHYLMLWASKDLLGFPAFFSFISGQTSHSLMELSGLVARSRTRLVWPMRSATLRRVSPPINICHKSIGSLYESHSSHEVSSFIKLVIIIYIPCMNEELEIWASRYLLLQEDTVTIRSVRSFILTDIWGQMTWELCGTADWVSGSGKGSLSCPLLFSGLDWPPTTLHLIIDYLTLKLPLHPALICITMLSVCVQWTQGTLVD